MRAVLQLSNNQTILENEMLMNKRDFKKFMKIENEKAEINQKFNEVSSKSLEKTQKIRKNKNSIEALDDIFKYMNTASFTFTGSISQVKEQLKNHRTKMADYLSEKHVLEREMKAEIINRNEIKKKFDFETLTAVMEVEIFEHDIKDKKKKKIEDKDKDWKNFLKEVQKLPDELLRTIQSYFTYETKAAILYEKYEPIKLFHSLNKRLLNKYIYVIYNKYCKSMPNKFFKDKLMVMWQSLYKDHNKRIEEKRIGVPSFSKLKTFIQYLFVLFQYYNYSQFCFELYRDIIIIKKYLDEPVVLSLGW